MPLISILSYCDAMGLEASTYDLKIPSHTTNPVQHITAFYLSSPPHSWQVGAQGCSADLSMSRQDQLPLWRRVRWSRLVHPFAGHRFVFQDRGIRGSCWEGIVECFYDRMWSAFWPVVVQLGDSKYFRALLTIEGSFLGSSKLLRDAVGGSQIKNAPRAFICARWIVATSFL